MKPCTSKCQSADLLGWPAHWQGGSLIPNSKDWQLPTPPFWDLKGSPADPMETHGPSFRCQLEGSPNFAEDSQVGAGVEISRADVTHLYYHLYLHSEFQAHSNLRHFANSLTSKPRCFQLKFHIIYRTVTFFLLYFPSSFFPNRNGNLERQWKKKSSEIFHIFKGLKSFLGEGLFIQCVWCEYFRVILPRLLSADEAFSILFGVPSLTLHPRVSLV